MEKLLEEFWRVASATGLLKLAADGAKYLWALRDKPKVTVDLYIAYHSMNPAEEMEKAAFWSSVMAPTKLLPL